MHNTPEFKRPGPGEPATGMVTYAEWLDSLPHSDRERLIRMMLDLDPNGESMHRLQVLKGYRPQ